jgi:hypothetical protein
MNRFLRIASAASLAAAALATPAVAGCGAHSPIPVGHRGVGPITPYFFPDRAGYRYNSPGPVFCRLPDWEPREGCRLWRYNYLYWTC